MSTIDFNAMRVAKEERNAKFDAAFEHFFNNTTQEEQAEFWEAFQSGDDARMTAIKERIKTRRRQ